MAFYGIIIRVYFLVINIAALFSAKAQKWVVGRRNWREKIAAVDFSQNQWLWFHFSSYGEFQDGQYLIELIRKQYAEYKILLTFFSSTGIELTQQYKGADYICFLPLDTANNADFMIKHVKPQCMFFIRNDIWPNYIWEARKNNVPVFLAIFALNASSSFLKFPVRAFYQKTFRKFTAVFTQDATTCELLSANSFNENVIVTGNARVDRVLEIGREEFKNSNVENFISGGFCFLAGSTHIDDRKLFVETFLKLENEAIKWIIVPHEIDTDEKEAARKQLGDKVIFYSEASQLNEKAKLLWVDHVGILAQLYRYADVVFVGGGFDRGGIHSMIEPLVYGCPVCFGPENRSYKEVTDLIASGGAAVVHNSQDLSAFVLKYKQQKELLAATKQANRDYLLKAGGASSKILSYLDEKGYL
jgi:3-deoxy-D-manno-octulosonic-acid transferase